MSKLFFLFCFILIHESSFAFPFEYADEVIITKPVHENLYISGGHVVINAPLYADLIVAGGIVQINDSVRRDILAVGGEVTFNGYTEGNIRCAGARFHILKNVKGDLVIVSGNVIVEKEATVDGIIALTGGSIIFDGTAKNDFQAKCGNIQFNGIGEKNVYINCRQLDISGTVSGKAVLVADEILVDSNASFKDTVNYWSKKGRVNFGTSAIAGRIIYDESLAEPNGYWYYFGKTSLLSLIWYLGASLLTIAIIVFLFNRSMKKAADKVLDAPFKSFGIGALFFIGVPAAIIFLFITFFGIPVSLLIFACYIVMLLLASMVTSVVISNWFNNRWSRKMSYLQLVLFSFLIFLILKSLSSLFSFGYILIIIGYCMSIGGLIRSITWKRGKIMSKSQTAHTPNVS
ncbi:MAG: hypothetical protein JST87_04850 [Bacteroidetes bacterium]|nr:hypothetical protein [Bacteroidota bacterium]